MPADIADGDDTQLTEGQVEGFVTNGAINLASGTTLNGQEILTDISVLNPEWANLQGVPSDLADGDDDSLGNINCSTGEISVGMGPNGVCSGCRYRHSVERKCC